MLECWSIRSRKRINKCLKPIRITPTPWRSWIICSDHPLETFYISRFHNFLMNTVHVKLRACKLIIFIISRQSLISIDTGSRTALSCINSSGCHTEFIIDVQLSFTILTAFEHNCAANCNAALNCNISVADLKISGNSEVTFDNESLLSCIYLEVTI